LLEPRLHLGYVRLRHAETGGKLVGRESLVVLGRGGILLGCEQGLEVGLLRGGTTEIEADAAEPGIGGHAAGVILGQRKRMFGTPQHDYI
jgi:hypothetical protein